MSKLPPRTSYTQLSTLQQCGFKYYLKYQVGLERTTKSLGLMRGTLGHEALDAYMFSGRTSHDVAYARVEELAQESINSGADPDRVDQAVKEVTVALEAYLPWSDENDDFEVVLLPGQEQCETSGEYSLELPDGSSYPFFFKIDALIRRGGSLLMMEHKFRKNLDSSGLEHDLQILLYQAAWNALHPDMQLEGVLYNIVAAKPRKKDGAIAVREFYYRGEVEQRIGLRMAAAMQQNAKLQAESGLWPMSPRKECNYMCDFVGMCMAVRSGASVEEFVDNGDYQLRESSRPAVRDIMLPDDSNSEDE